MALQTDSNALRPARPAELIRLLKLLPHPEGGHFRELFRSPHPVAPSDTRPVRSALTCIDFLLSRGEFSAWHRVVSDEVWHLLEGGPLRLWLMSPALEGVLHVDLAGVAAGCAPRHVVPAGWWQSAEPLAGYALCGATVAPGFDFADFSFLRDDPEACAALRQHDALLQRLL